MVKQYTDKLNALVEELLPQLINLRRELHQIPEVAWQEKKTSARISRWLKKSGVDHRTVAGTGILGQLQAGSGRVVAVRSDIDALPVSEQTDLPFKSQHAGRMHACGHDMHMAIVSGCAAVLARLPEARPGTVKFIFQPAEEAPPGGAEEMIKAGVMVDPRVEMVFGLHVNPEIPTGKIGLRDGPLMAGVLDFDIRIIGEGGHAALPHRTKDPIVCAAALVQGLQTLVSRNIDPFEPAVVSIGKIDGGTARNILPAECRLEATARALNQKTLSLLQRRITTLARGIAKGYGCKAELTVHDGYPPLLNDPQANRFLAAAAERTLGRRAWQPIANPSMGGEDFARYLEQAPGAMFHLGIRNAKLGSTRGWHHPEFMADENAIGVGVKVLTQAVLDYLQ
jgi:amidohydrolase